MDYISFLRNKIDIAKDTGFDVSPSEITPELYPHARDGVIWACKGGRRAIFESFGMHKTVQELEWCRLVAKHTGGQTLIVMPLDVRGEFYHDAQEILHMEKPAYVRTMAEVAENADKPILITNYERVRDGDINLRHFAGVSLDEASVLRSYGSKTYEQFTAKAKGVPYKLVATATPSPNKLKELIHYAGYLEIMDTGQALTRFFQRNSSKANDLTLYPHKEDEFWLWVSSWGLYATEPADFGYSNDGFSLPPMDIRYHELPVDHTTAGADKHGQMKLLRDAALSLQDAAREKRESIEARVKKAAAIVAEDPEAHFIIWHDLEAERHAIKKALPPRHFHWHRLRV
jgi:hypothetical protein